MMAIWFNGMTDEEINELTFAMAESGDTVDLSKVNGFTVDKHSTGGVGDKTTLIAVPIVAACGGKIAKMSGRGLGHTGGTVDKLESIAGFNTSLDAESFIDCVNKTGLCVIGQTGNLTPADILSQFLSIDEAEDLSNAVFMGMGEPLDNWENVRRVLEVLTADWGFAWSPKRITLSSIGVIPNLKKYLDESKCHLAISLHDPFPEERASLMPMEKAWHLRDIIALLKEYDFTGQRRVSFEYTMFDGFNDSLRHADELVRLLSGIESRVNLIRFHKIPDFPYGTSSRETMEAFRDRLSKRGVTSTIRASRGEDILAACGMLAGKHNKNRADE